MLRRQQFSSSPFYLRAFWWFSTFLIISLPETSLPAEPFLVRDINANGVGSSPLRFTVVGDRIFFTADDGLHGSELWALPLDAADSDDSGSLDLTDVVHSLEYLLLGGPDPKAPFPDCVEDGTADGLGCAWFPDC